MSEREKGNGLSRIDQRWAGRADLRGRPTIVGACMYRTLLRSHAAGSATRFNSSNSAQLTLDLGPVSAVVQRVEPMIER
jgi:hypothetical protein